MKKLLHISDLKQKDFDDIMQYSIELNTSNENLLSNKNIGLILLSLVTPMTTHWSTGKASKSQSELFFILEIIIKLNLIQARNSASIYNFYSKVVL